MAALRIWLEEFLEEWDKTHLRGKKNSDFYGYQGGGGKVRRIRAPSTIARLVPAETMISGRERQ
jgi:hypothetical protein